MCQMSVVMEHDGQQEKILENVSFLEVTPEGISIGTLFEEPKLVPGAALRKIDFLGGTVTLTAAGGGKCND